MDDIKDAEDGVIGEHEMNERLEQQVFYPNHAERKQTKCFIESKNQMKKEGVYSCAICRR
jgi:hypothetical protein